jgi:hypothetical protein
MQELDSLEHRWSRAGGFCYSPEKQEYLYCRWIQQCADMDSLLARQDCILAKVVKFALNPQMLLELGFASFFFVRNRTGEPCC